MKLENSGEEYQPPKSGLFLLQVCIVLLFSLFCARFWYLQIHRGTEYARMAQENRLRHEIRETLLASPYIRQVDGFRFQRAGSRLTVRFTVHTVYEGFTTETEVRTA